MHNIAIMLQKEFRQVFRNPTILRMILIMPVIQLILIPFAADYEVKNIRFSVIDQDHSDYSRRLTGKINASAYLSLWENNQNYSEALRDISKGETDIVIHIPAHFAKDLIKENDSKIYIAADAVNGIKAGLGVAYAGAIIQDFNREIREEWIHLPRFNEMPLINIETSQWYNPHVNYKLFMVPGILALLVTMVGSFMTALNIVAEKEMGTIEQLNVTPLKKHEFILGKLLPFWVLGLVSITLGMIVSFVVFGLLPAGSFFTIYAFAAIYLLSVLGIGLLVSTFAETQQQATLFAFFIMMVFVLMSGLYTPVESMPWWAQYIAAVNPPAHFIKVIRAVFIKGSGFSDLGMEFIWFICFALVFNALAIFRYRKTTA